MANAPNIIVFLTDDQGYGDLSCMGCTDFRTPHLDQMAREGVRFTDWYSNSPVCSP
ncbi:MAG: sulfatase, partial [Gemmatimonadetes bacterium]|nr:sulfatase [Gemmatimonadota bacterium]